MKDYINPYNIPNWLTRYDFSVYGNLVNGDTLQEVLSNFAYYINEVISIVNKYTNDLEDTLKWLKGEGVTNAVNKKMEELIKEGYFEDLINDQLFTDFDDKLNKLAKLIEELKESDIEINKEIFSIKENIEGTLSTINELKESIKNNKNEIDKIKDSINEIKVELYDSFEFKASKKYLLTSTNISEVLQQIVDDNEGLSYHSIVYIPPANYIFNKTVERLNNIYIVFDKKATLKVADSCIMGAFTNGQIDKDDYPSGYSAGGNIVIENANFISDIYAFGFALGTNIKLKNLKLRFKEGAHGGEIAGVDGFTIDKGYFKSTGKSENYREEAEVIQIQTTTPSAFSYYGRRHTLPCKNVKFSRVTIDGASTGLGSHGAVYGTWEESFIFEKCNIKNCTIGLRLFGFKNVIITDCTFEENKYDILSKGLIKNDDLNRPFGQATQDVQLNNVVFRATRGDKEACIHFDNRRRTADEGGLGKSENIVMNNVIFATTGYACRFHNVEGVTLSNLTGYSDKGIRFSNAYIVSLANINMESKSDVHCVIFSKDPDYYTDGVNKYVNIKCCNLKAVNKGIGVYDTFEGNIQDNSIQLTGPSSEKMAIEIGGGGKKFYVSNNVEYCHTPQTGPTFSASQYASEVYFNSNLSKGYTGSNNTQNDSTGNKGTFKPSYA